MTSALSFHTGSEYSLKLHLKSGEHMDKKKRRILNIILILALIAGLVVFGRNQHQNYLGRLVYDEAIMIADAEASGESVLSENPAPEAPKKEAWKPGPMPDDPYIEELLNVDLASLQEENEDVLGWICIPDSKINYPLLQWTDNDFYLKHTWKQTKNFAGSIFMECQNSPDFSDFNTIIYGHNMNNGDMFGGLRKYHGSKYLKEHPSVYILNEYGVFRYDIFAVQKAGVESVVYRMQIDSDQKKQEVIRFAKDYSTIETDIYPTIDDRILTLSTCSGQGYKNRWVVMAVLNEAGSYQTAEYDY